jgi:hypothetical protein
VKALAVVLWVAAWFAGNANWIRLREPVGTGEEYQLHPTTAV